MTRLLNVKVLQMIWLGAIFGAFGSSAYGQSVTCFSAVPNACSGGAYNEEVVIGYYRPIFQFMAQNPTLNPEGPVPGNICINTCEAAFRQNVAACRSLPNNDPVIGESARNICLEVSEQAYRSCLEGCIFN